MPGHPLAKSALLMVILVLAAVICWELYLRNKGYDTSYNDDGALWSDKRAMVYEPADKATVFIGASRIKFDLDIDEWQRITGNHAIQLACVGSNPIPVLQNLADDKNFKGRLVVDVTEGLFFAPNGHIRRPVENMKYYKDETPAQRAGFFINHLLESKFVFLDKEWLSLSAMMDHLPLKNRPGTDPFGGFPSEFGRVKFSRQEYMTDKFSSDTALQNIVKNIWQSGPEDVPVTGATLDSILLNVKTAVDKIKVRGGQVLFVRTPSSGSYLESEMKLYPREKYWDRILSVTGCPGIHFADYPAMAHFICPENSHLSLHDATIFTRAFIKIMEEEKGWKFSKDITVAN